jgi:hypothetical protein
MAWMWWLLAPVASTLLGALWLWRPTLPAGARRRWRAAAPIAEHRRFLDALPGADRADGDRAEASNVLLLPGSAAPSNAAADPLTGVEASAS